MSDRGDGNIERPSSSPQLFFFFPKVREPNLFISLKVMMKFY